MPERGEMPRHSEDSAGEKKKREEENAQQWAARAISPNALAMQEVVKRGAKAQQEREGGKDIAEKELTDEEQMTVLRDIHNDMVNVFQSERYRSWEDAKKQKDQKEMHRTATTLEEWLSGCRHRAHCTR
jgi:hypothetical protein